jgi:hypothetical protein
MHSFYYTPLITNRATLGIGLRSYLPIRLKHGRRMWNRLDVWDAQEASCVLLHCGKPTYIQGEGVYWGDAFPPTDTFWEASLLYNWSHVLFLSKKNLLRACSLTPKTEEDKQFCSTMWTAALRIVEDYRIAAGLEGQHDCLNTALVSSMDQVV